MSTTSSRKKFPPVEKQSRIPYPLRFQSGVVFVTLPGLFFIGVWTAAVVYVHVFHFKLGVDGVLVSLLGIISALATGFRLRICYQRFQSAREEWSGLTVTIRNLARLIWFNIPDGLQMNKKTVPPPTEVQIEQKLREDILSKASVIRVLVGFAFALKHHVRREWGTDWPDLRGRIGFLPTFARHGPSRQMTVSQSLYTSIDPEKNLPAIPSSDSATGWAHNLFSNKEDARNQKVKTTIAQQNLPLEILSFLGSYASNIHTEKRIEGGLTHAFHSELRRLNEALGKCEMLMQPSMPLTYLVTISQIQWLFLLLLPFQLVGTMEWITIPAVLLTSFCILSLSYAASALDYPFVSRQNATYGTGTSLHLSRLCDTLAIEVDVITSSTHQSVHSYVSFGEGVDQREKKGLAWMHAKGNKPLLPLVRKDYAECVGTLALSDILEVMGVKVEMPEV